jgi:HK97 family phage major capsid protein
MKNSNLRTLAGLSSELIRASKNPTLSESARLCLRTQAARYAEAGIADACSPAASVSSPLLVNLGRAARSSISCASALTAEQHEAQTELRAQFSGVNSPPLGVVLPWRESRTFSATGETAIEGDQGGDTVGTAVPSIGLAFRDKLVLAQLGATVLLGLRENLQLPKEQPGINASWKAETAAADSANTTFAALDLAPLRCTAYLDVAAQLLLQGPLVEPWLRLALAAALAEAVQAVLINGSGSNNEPLGILCTPGIGNVADGGGNGSAPVYVDLAQLEYLVTTAKADAGNLGFLTSPKVRKALRSRLLSFGNQNDTNPGALPVWPLNQPEALLGYPAGVTTGCPDTLLAGAAGATASAIIFGEWSELFVGVWGPGVLVDAIPIVSGADGMKGLVRFVASIFLNGGLRSPSAFAAKKDCLCA